MKYNLNENHLMINILQNLPKEYDTLFYTMERDISDYTKTFTIEGVKKRLKENW